MPKLAHRNRPLLAVLCLLFMTALLALTLIPTVGSRLATAGEPTASEPPPSDPPPEEDCGGYGTAGPLPDGSLTISGTVSDAASIVGGLEGIEVRFSTLSGHKADSVTTGPGGSYALGGLGDGTYLVAFHDYGGLYQGGFRGAAGPVATPLDAVAIILSGGDAAGVDIALPAEQSLGMSGTVTDQLGAPVAGIRLNADGAYLPLFSCASSIGDGTYAISGVRAGAYYIRVTDPSGAYPNGWYSNQEPGGFVVSKIDATLVVTDGTDLSGIDVQFPQTFTLSGDVLDGLTGVEGVWVTACSGPNGPCQGASTGPEGSYTISRLVVGDYLVRMYGGGYGFLNGYYGGPGILVLDVNDALAVSVTTDVAGIDLPAVAAPTVSGTVTDALGAGIEGMALYLSDPETGESAYAVTGPGGSYAATGVQPGNYLVEVYDTAYPAVQPRGYRDAARSLVADPADASLVVVGTADLPGVDVEVPDGGVLELSVVQGGAPVPFAWALICLTEVVCIAGDAAVDGAVTFPALLPGTYRVALETDIRHWYVSGGPAVESFASASEVVVSAGVTTAIAVTLPSAGTETPEGTNVEVPLDDGSGSTPVTLTFDNVVGGGTTSLTIPIDPPALPTGFKFGDPPTYYEIETTATFDGSISVCISFNPADYTDPAGVRLLHFAAAPEPGSWVDITILPVNTLDGIVCGLTDSLSPIVVAERTYPFGGFFGPKPPPQLNYAKAGDLVGVQFSLGGNLGTEVFQAGSPTVQQIDCGSGALLGNPAAAESGTVALKFNAKAERYTFSWKTSKSWKTTCQVLALTFRDGTTAAVWFQF